MAINSNPNIKGKKKSSTSATATPSKPWSKRVQAAPKPLSKKKADADEETSAAASAPAPTPNVAAGKKRKSAEDAPVASSSKSPKASKKVVPAAAAASVPASEPILSGYHSTSEDDEEADSSDDDDDDSDVEVDTNPVDVGSLPTVAKDDASVARKLARAKKVAGTEKGVLYLGRVPHGFYEKQMKSYFEQFGDVEKVRLARNKKVSPGCELPILCFGIVDPEARHWARDQRKIGFLVSLWVDTNRICTSLSPQTGKSKHYAFILMSSLSVAKIVAETMDNYLLLGHILRCKVRLICE